ncbi:MAG: hydantoinase B/oxoprolinase family protein, partial [Candidatus Wallbacteria bacterium]|nr:hydantoinase B/oxoprolinase family protein [Candidatus Wallbacteria bacterium]
MIDAVETSIFASLFSALCEEMGAALMLSAFSPNIKERRDFSTALFSPEGRLVAQAAHIPVHLGSMGFALRGVLGALELGPGDMAVLNDPYLGGTHLPDITVVAPVHAGGRLAGYVANRAHHSDIGGRTAGSMGAATCLTDEGLIIGPTRLVEAGNVVSPAFDAILAAVRTPDERAGDLQAQIAANRTGARRLAELCAREGSDRAAEAMQAVLGHGRRVALATLGCFPPGSYSAEDFLDDDGLGLTDIPIRCRVTLRPDRFVADFTGTAPQVPGNLNAVFPVTFAAVAYCFRCLMPPRTPSSAGCFEPLEVLAPAGCLLNPERPAAVAAGNVETSQRIVDTVLLALSRALPDRVPAASSGSMNNFAFTGVDPASGQPFSYYETIAGGMGARPGAAGLDAVHTHMTNTLNTPVEALELAYPVRVTRYEVRRGSGGRGRHAGGNGVVREIEVLCDAELSISSERRRREPYG